MIIQLNSDHNLIIKDDYRDSINTLLTGKLNRFSSHITRLEVHFSDENGNKEGLKDKQCILEARVEGMQPIAVKEIANTYDQAIQGGIAKLKSALETRMGKLKEH